MLDALVIGSGPAGLATSAMLQHHGARFRLVDREAAIGGAYTRMNPDVVLITPARFVRLPGLAISRGDTYLGATVYRDYLRAYASEHRLAPDAATVEAVRAEGVGYRVDLRGGEQIATRTVVVATGMFDFPERPEISGSGIPVIHSSEWRTDLARPGSHIVVVGGATSAVEIAEMAARRDCRVTVATRKLRIAPHRVVGVDLAYALLPIAARVRPRKFCEGVDPAPGTDRGFASLRRRGAIAVRVELTRIDGDHAVFADGQRTHADLVVLATGYRFQSAFLPADLARTPRGAARCTRNESVSHPGIYFVGSPCARTAASQFLYGISRDAVDVARAITSSLPRT
jgi:putative flavoprotein involved in K+ transport